MLKSKAKKTWQLSISTTITLSVLVVILLGAFLLMLPVSSKDGNWMNFFDAIFTSSSAVCITGLLKFDIATHFTLFGQIIILVLIQVGALGFMTVATFLFILIGKKIRFKERLLIKETINHDSNQGVVRMARKIIFATFAIELVGALVLLPSMLSLSGGVGTAVFRSIFMSVSAFCNAGIDVMGSVSGEFSSVSYFAKSAFILLPLAFLVIIGGLGFAVVFDIMRVRRAKKVLFHTQVVIYMTLILIIAGALLFAIFEWSNPDTLGSLPNTSAKILNAFFASVTPRTAGFTTFNVRSMTPAGRMMISVMSFIGASPASTGGGIKTTTFFVLLMIIMKGTNESNELIYRKRTIPSKVVYKSLLVLFLGLTLITGLTFALCILEGDTTKINSIEALLFEALNAFTTTGMTYGITPFLSRASLMLISVTMIAGRLGTLALTLAIFERSERNTEVRITYSEGKIMVG